ncbi:MAG: electron transfer flavoprotein subunit beta/FixA family protein [Candidatus Mcinerneyibacterium aminivorans]|uniref:Electron transfer flavoprotein subunit beta/FixA family protein n=1 Tax=Candidatus Mcinerneyibacterium aminivorans TaxID=2703815 RepID=A0A5D0MJD1_9BACT|nr:MAG: electron transfer flavoprotein subunit beta/FixA family protein [Candidatus Mcinerneyibacterium aminivorans]
MSYKIVVLAKQVPDTHDVSGDVMKEDGTINRSALPAVFNPEDLNALEMALEIKDKYDAEIHVITMGPPSAVEILKQSLYRGADKVYLASDIKFAGSDTWATAYSLASIIEKIAPDYDMVFAGRQAIDGDTAQVGPQVSEKLDITQITYVKTLNELNNKKAKLTRMIEGGEEVIEANFPFLATVVDEANDPRPPEVRKMMKYKNAMTRLNFKDALHKMVKFDDEKELKNYLKNRGLLIPVIEVSDLDIDLEKIGIFGSPTKVKNIESVVLKKEKIKELQPDKNGAMQLMRELKNAKIVG